MSSSSSRKGRPLSRLERAKAALGLVRIPAARTRVVRPAAEPGTGSHKHHRSMDSTDDKSQEAALDEWNAAWLKRPPDRSRISRPDPQIHELEFIAARVNRKNMRGTFPCRIDLSIKKAPRNTIKKNSAYKTTQREDGKKAATSQTVFDPLEDILEESTQYYRESSLERANSSRNLLEELESLHSVSSNLGRDSGRSSQMSSNSSLSQFSASAFSAASVTNRKIQNKSTFSSARTPHAQLTLKETERLESIFNFTRVQLKHARHLEFTYFLSRSLAKSVKAYSLSSFWWYILGEVQRQYNFYKEFTALLLERLHDFSHSCETTFLEIGDLLLNLTKSELFKEIVFTSFSECHPTPAKDLDAMLRTSFPQHVVYSDFFDGNTIRACSTYQRFLAQYLSHCAYLQRLAVLSLPYQILDLLTYSTRTLDREIVNIQESLNESFVCLAIANVGYAASIAKRTFIGHCESGLLKIDQATKTMRSTTLLFCSQARIQVESEDPEFAKEAQSKTSCILLLTRKDFIALRGKAGGTLLSVGYHELQLIEIEVRDEVSSLVLDLVSGGRVRVSLEPQHVNRFVFTWNFVCKTWDSEAKYTKVNGYMKVPGEADVKARLTALHLWVNLVPLETDSMNILKHGITACSEPRCGQDHFTLEMGCSMLEGKIAAMITDSDLVSFLHRFVSFSNARSTSFISSVTVSLEDIIVNPVSNKLLVALNALPDKAATPGALPPDESSIERLLADEVTHVNHLLHLLKTIKSVKENHLRTELSDSLIALFQLHCQLVSRMTETKEQKLPVTEVFAQLPNLSLIISCLYQFVEDRRAINFVLNECWRVLGYLAFLEPLVKAQRQHRDRTLVNIFNYLLVCITEMLGVIEHLRVKDPSNYGFNNWCLRNATGRILNRIVRFNTKVIKSEKIDSCQMVPSVNNKGSPQETGERYTEAYLHVLREAFMATIGNDREYIARWYIQYADISAIALYFVVDTQQSPPSADSMLRVDLKDGSYINLWGTLPAEEAARTPITYYDYILLLILRAKTNFDVMQSDFPDLSANDGIMENLADFRGKLEESTKYMIERRQGLDVRQDHELDREMTRTVGENLLRFRRQFLEQFDLNFIVSEVDGRRNESFSLDLSNM